ncbi:deoxyhypusine synthase-like [Corticium candelabrum]|uniref:deoxyhypusine synthase-like n=1 Tax=Corticium candelabrum TaxID=121492 RepID=UPI002E26EC8B|nr:deoxyhypusine synthase-like [Corticium candelabrum]
MANSAKEAVFVPSVEMSQDSVVIKGYDFNKGVDHRALLESYARCGFQATKFGHAVREIDRMLDAKEMPLSEEKQESARLLQNVGDKPLSNCTIFLGYTSNMITSGIRETLRFLTEQNMVDCIVTTTGGIEEDLIKCMGSFYVGEFTMIGSALREQGINRTGNILVPNVNYCKFEEWIHPILDRMLEEQTQQAVSWTPSKFIARLGKEIDHEDSVYYWAYKNSIPVFCPALTDGAIGDCIFFHSIKNPGLKVDMVEDICRINTLAMRAANTGMIVLGAGVVKHHIYNANLMRNGADFAVNINTAQEFDGSDAGARPDEAVSWGKIKKTASPVKVCADASLVFPLLVAETFAKRHWDRKALVQS